MVYLHGYGQIVPGLERALVGKKVGEQLQVVVEPRDGYGENAASKPIRVPKKDLPPGVEPEEGMGFNTVTPEGQELTLWVIGSEKDEVLFSLDHPLAGVTLHFDVTIREVRAATKDELAHGHAHGPEGHHHH
jgi:FKBP-type peptidyl-prolyl cis-trans isomerase SlyD